MCDIKYNPGLSEYIQDSESNDLLDSDFFNTHHTCVTNATTTLDLTVYGTFFLTALQPHLVSAEAFNEGISLLHASVHDQSNSHRQTAQDLLVLRLLSVAHHVLDGLGRLGAQHDQTEGQARSFT